MTKEKNEIGVVGFNWNQKSVTDAEIGIIIIKKFHQSGYGYETAYAAMKYAFTTLDIKNIIALCKNENAAVNFMADKLGFNKSFVDTESKPAFIKWIINYKKLELKNNSIKQKLGSN